MGAPTPAHSEGTFRGPSPAQSGRTPPARGVTPGKPGHCVRLDGSRYGLERGDTDWGIKARGNVRELGCIPLQDLGEESVTAIGPVNADNQSWVCVFPPLTNAAPTRPSYRLTWPTGTRQGDD